MTETEPEPPAPSRGENVLPWMVVSAALAFRLYLLFTTHRTAEDFYITLRYAENIATGRGFVYNPGQHVLGTTTPLYTLFLAFAHWAGLSATSCGQLVNVVADSLVCRGLWQLAKSAGQDTAGLIAAAVYAAWPPALYWSISGMETGLVTLCVVSALHCAAERKAYRMAAWTAALVLLRIDGLLLASICFGFLWIDLTAETKSGRVALASPSALFLGLLAPWAVFATWYFGSPIPTSLVAKLHVYGWQSPGLLPNLRPFARDMTRNALYWLLLTGVIPGLAAGWRRRPLRPAFVWMALYYAGMAFTKSFLFGWYYVPPAPIYILVSVTGWAGMAGAVLKRAWNVSAAVPATLILVAGALVLPKQQALIAADQGQDEALLKSTGLLLRERVKRGETVMLEPIGWIGYYSRARVLDAVGLVSPEVISYFRQGSVSPYLDIMHDLNPDWVLLRTGEYDHAANAPVPPGWRLADMYEVVRDIPNPADPLGRPAFYLLKRR